MMIELSKNTDETIVLVLIAYLDAHNCYVLAVIVTVLLIASASHDSEKESNDH